MSWISLLATNQSSRRELTADQANDVLLDLFKDVVHADVTFYCKSIHAFMYDRE